MEISFKTKKIINRLKYADKLSEFFLNLIYKKLNKIHNTNYPKKYWKILLIYWLKIYCNFYLNICEDFKKKKISNKKLLLKNFYTNDTFLKSETLLRLIYNKNYRERIYQSILNNFSIKMNNQITKRKKFLIIEKKKILDETLISLNKKNLYQFFLSKLNHHNKDYLIIESQLGLFKEFLLNLKLNQFPVSNNFRINMKENNYDYKVREKLKKKHIKEKSVRFLFNSICNELPKCFIENFKYINQIIKKINLPKNPKVIFSSYALHGDTILNFYLAKNLLKKTKLIYYQHGGSYGINEYHFQEKLEINLSDLFISWGWKKNNKKIISLASPYNNRTFTIQENKKILIVFKSPKLYNKGLNLGSSTETIENYFYRQKKLLQYFKNMDVEYSFPQFHPETKNITNKNYNYIIKNFKPCTNKKFFKKLINYNLILNTDISTPHLETMFYRIPNILILDKNNVNFNSFSRPIFSLLEKNKLLFFSNKKAYKFIDFLIYKSSIKLWWNSENVQEAVTFFNKNFAHTKKNMLDDILKILKNIKNT